MSGKQPVNTCVPLDSSCKPWMEEFSFPSRYTEVPYNPICPERRMKHEAKRKKRTSLPAHIQHRYTHIQTSIQKHSPPPPPIRTHTQASILTQDIVTSAGHCWKCPRAFRCWQSSQDASHC